MSDYVTTDLCKERHKQHADSLERIEKKVDEIKELLLGNGKLGVFGKINILWGVTSFLVLAVVSRFIIWAFSFLPK